MPKWTDYTIKTTVADNDEVMVLDTAGKANKRLSLSTLSDWVLGKIADKVFEKLQTNDKTILGAINELNSNAFSTNITYFKVTPLNSYTFNENYTYIYRCNNIVSIQFLLDSEFHSDYYEVFTIPSECIPNKQVWFTCFYSNGDTRIGRGMIRNNVVSIIAANKLLDGVNNIFGYVMFLSK